jgi:hypothetical protein
VLFSRFLQFWTVGAVLVCLGCGDEAAPSAVSEPGPFPPGSLTGTAGGPGREVRQEGGGAIASTDPALMMQNGHIYNLPPHQAVANPFQAGSASVEVMATCSFEKGIQCTNLKGARVKEYEQKLVAELKRRDEKWGDSAIPYRIGLKNRAVIFKVKQVLGLFEPRWVAFAGPPSNHGNAEVLGNPGPGQTGQSQIHEAVAFIAVPPKAKTGSISGLLRQPIRASKSFKLAPSSITEIDQHQIKVLSIDKEPRGRLWIVRFELVKTQPSELVLRLRLIDPSGRLIEYADRDGRPVDEARRKELMDQYVREQTTGTMRPVVLANDIALSKEGKNRFMARIPVDPQYIQEATLSGEMHVLYDIRNIPLGSD